MWITGHKTGDYEKIVFGGDMDPEDSPIALPDLMGWLGSQPITIGNSIKLSIGFSGLEVLMTLKLFKMQYKKYWKIIK